MTMRHRMDSFVDLGANVLRRYALHRMRGETGRLYCTSGLSLTVFTATPNRPAPARCVVATR